MKKVFFIMSLVALATACTNDEEAPVTLQKSKYITYETSVGTRAEMTTINNLDAFSVTAYLAQNDDVMRYINEMEVKKVEGIWTPGKTDVWPHSGTMRFYSCAPQSDRLQCVYPVPEGSEIPVPQFTYDVSSNADQQLDVIYSVTERDCAGIYGTQPENETADVVNINFRHALSQIAIRAQNVNPDWKVRISNVTLINVKHQGTYTFPTQSTLPGNEVIGSWQLTENKADYQFTFKEVVLDGAQTVDMATTEKKNTLLLLPQTTAPWDNVNDPKCTQKGAYFLITCNIKQVKDGKDVQLWPSIDKYEYDATRNIAIPATINWAEGKRYTYNIKFGDGAGFFPPGETEGGLPAGEQTLKAIKYDVTVDDFNSQVIQN